MAGRTEKIRINATADGDNTVIAAPPAGFRIRVFKFVITIAGAAAHPVTIRSGAAGTIHAQYSLPIDGGVAFTSEAEDSVFDLDSGAALNINNSAGSDALGNLTYRIEPV